MEKSVYDIRYEKITETHSRAIERLLKARSLGEVERLYRPYKRWYRANLATLDGDLKLGRITEDEFHELRSILHYNFAEYDEQAVEKVKGILSTI